ncbi:MAG TPA: pinensin family lanthipeptide [Longimicrobium sp.]|nr:pinensin family lanthipeptide [Longimicrobium sp.]
MTKLKLQLDDLEVVSFETAEEPTATGTVMGQQEPDRAAGIVWTGCMSECTECTFGGAGAGY